MLVSHVLPPRRNGDDHEMEMSKPSIGLLLAAAIFLFLSPLSFSVFISLSSLLSCWKTDIVSVAYGKISSADPLSSHKGQHTATSSNLSASAVIFYKALCALPPSRPTTTIFHHRGPFPFSLSLSLVLTSFTHHFSFSLSLILSFNTLRSTFFCTLILMRQSAPRSQAVPQRRAQAVTLLTLLL